MKEIKNVQTISQELLTDIQRILERFWITKNEEKEYDFYSEVKPAADLIHAKTNEWVTLTKKWIAEKRPKYIHLNQIDSAAENIELIAVQCFFKSTSKKRFLNMCQSIIYILEDIIKKWEETR